MASAIPLSLLLLFSAGSLIAHAGSVADELHYVIVTTGSPKASSVCSGFKVMARPPSVADMLSWDKYRADYIRAKLSGDLIPQDDDLPVVTAKTTVVNHEGVLQPNLGTGNAPASPMGSQLSIGPEATGRQLPGVRQTMVIDTASDVPWVQCVPCPVPPCHPQTDAFYDPTKSGTYAAFSCNSPSCRQLGPYFNGCSNDSQCQYRVRYPDGSATMGTYVSDVLTLTPTAVVSKFWFGCSHAEQGSFNNGTSGIMALGGGPQSLVSQMAGTYGDVFSYCLPSSPSRKGFFTLGVPRVKASRFAVTPMVRNKQVPTFYMVVLKAIAVAGQRIDFPPAAFAAGAVMDSRAIITRLPPTVYAALRSAFSDSMRMYRRAAPRGHLDTCFDFTGVGGAIRLPRIELVFDREAVVELDPSGILFEDCLAFAPNCKDRMPGIIGNAQQQTMEVLYDVSRGAVGFRRDAC